MAAIGLTNATLDRVAGRTAVPGPPIASAGALIGGTIAALHGVTRRAAVPGSPPRTVAVAITIRRWRRIILSIRSPDAGDNGRSNQGNCKYNLRGRAHGEAPSSLHVH